MAIAAVLSVSNIFFWQSAGYFDAASDAKPLLHSWSLGVEEQFYFLFPSLIYFLPRLRAPLAVSLGAIALLSFAASVEGVEHHPSAAFYLIHTRAWEFLLGVLAVQLPVRLLANRGLREAIALAGLLAIATTILLYAPGTAFPGVAALPPCIGTAVLLASGRAGENVVRRVLSIRPVVFFGLISYSLYLWHLPVIVLAKQAIPEGSLRMPERFVALAVSVALAWLSWRYVERPLRSTRISARAIFWASGIGAVLTCLLGAGLMATGGLPQRFSPEVARIADYIDRPQPAGSHPCIIGLYGSPDTFDAGACLRPSAAKPNVLIFGDSHADHLVPGLRAAYSAINFMQATAAGCRTTIQGAANETPTCRAFRRRMFGDYLVRHPPVWVLLANFWGWEGIDQIGPTIDWFRAHGIRVILAGPVVRYEISMPLALAWSAQRGSEWPLAHTRIPDTAALDRRMAAYARAHDVIYLSPYTALCANGGCVTMAAGIPVQHDYGHLTPAGSRIVANAFPSAAVIRSSAAAAPRQPPR